MRYGIWGPDLNCWFGPAYLNAAEDYNLHSKNGKFDTEDINMAYRYLELCFKHGDCDYGKAYVKERE